MFRKGEWHFHPKEERRHRPRKRGWTTTLLNLAPLHVAYSNSIHKIFRYTGWIIFHVFFYDKRTSPPPPKGRVKTPPTQRGWGKLSNTHKEWRKAGTVQRRRRKPAPQEGAAQAAPPKRSEGGESTTTQKERGRTKHHLPKEVEETTTLLHHTVLSRYFSFLFFSFLFFSFLFFSFLFFSFLFFSFLFFSFLFFSFLFFSFLFFSFLFFSFLFFSFLFFSFLFFSFLFFSFSSKKEEEEAARLPGRQPPPKRKMRRRRQHPKAGGGTQHYQKEEEAKPYHPKLLAPALTCWQVLHHQNKLRLSFFRIFQNLKKGRIIPGEGEMDHRPENADHNILVEYFGLFLFFVPERHFRPLSSAEVLFLSGLLRRSTPPFGQHMQTDFSLFVHIFQVCIFGTEAFRFLASHVGKKNCGVPNQPPFSHHTSIFRASRILFKGHHLCFLGKENTSQRFGWLFKRHAHLCTKLCKKEQCDPCDPLWSSVTSVIHVISLIPKGGLETTTLFFSHLPFLHHTLLYFLLRYFAPLYFITLRFDIVYFTISLIWFLELLLCFVSFSEGEQRHRPKEEDSGPKRRMRHQKQHRPRRRGRLQHHPQGGRESSTVQRMMRKPAPQEEGAAQAAPPTRSEEWKHHHPKGAWGEKAPLAERSRGNHHFTSPYCTLTLLFFSLLLQKRRRWPHHVKGGWERQAQPERRRPSSTAQKEEEEEAAPKGGRRNAALSKGGGGQSRTTQNCSLLLSFVGRWRCLFCSSSWQVLHQQNKVRLSFIRKLVHFKKWRQNPIWNFFTQRKKTFKLKLVFSDS